MCESCCWRRCSRSSSARPPASWSRCSRWTPLARRIALVVLLVVLCTPAVARANGDPASDYLLLQSVFLPFNAKVDADVTARLSNVIREADKAGFPIKFAVIGSRYDMGTAFSLYNKPQSYARFLGLELAFQYRDRLVVVMPKGYGYAIAGKPDAGGARILKTLPAPGRDTTKEVEGATTAVRRLAAAGGHPLSASSSGAGGRQAPRVRAPPRPGAPTRSPPQARSPAPLRRAPAC